MVKSAVAPRILRPRITNIGVITGSYFTFEQLSLLPIISSNFLDFRLNNIISSVKYVKKINQKKYTICSVYIYKIIQ